MQIYIITPDCARYKIVQTTLRYEYPTALMFHKTQVRYIRNRGLNELFEIFNVS